jgi:RNA recognition motif-containing protein
MTSSFAGLESCDLVMSKEVPGQNRGFAFLVFYNHECAAAAKELIAKSSFK